MKPRRPTPDPTSLSDRDLAVLDDVSSFRALTGDQIRRLHFDHRHDGGSDAGARRVSQRVLKRLVDVGLLATLTRRVGGVRAGSAGLTYVLGYHGQRLIRPGRRARTPDTLGDRYVAHTLAVAEIAVGLRAGSGGHGGEHLAIEVEPMCWRAYPDGKRTATLKPDLFIAITDGDLEHRWFVEVDMATESLVRVRSKCQGYLDYYATGIENDLHGVFPKVAWIVPDDRRADQITSVVHSMRSPAREMFVVTTAARSPFANATSQKVKGSPIGEVTNEPSSVAGGGS